MPHDFSREEIHYAGKINKPRLYPDVGDINHPHLVFSHHHKARQVIFGVPIVVIRVRGLDFKTTPNQWF